MTNSHKVSAFTIFAIASLMAAGEVTAGTSALFAALVAATLICIGVTYNCLGGLSTIRGMAFAAFALGTLVISQCAKVIFRQAADKALEAPRLTIEVYSVFYFCVLVGCFVYGGVRFRLPRPSEPVTPAQADLQYAIAVLTGLAANITYEYYESSSAQAERSNGAHSISLAFTPMLLYSIVLAVKRRIDVTDGRHSFGLKVFFPWIAVVIFGMIETSRAHIMLSTVTYAISCYSSRFRFRTIHYCTAILGVAVCILVVSPFEMLSRGPIRELGFTDRISEGFLLLTSSSNQRAFAESDNSDAPFPPREDYYDHIGPSFLSRLSAIRLDSNMINACTGGFHYGLSALKIDALRSLPRFFDKDKPDIDGSAYTGRVTGINPDDVENGEAMVTIIGDGFGAFGWLGVAAAGFLILPLVLIVYESVFDIRTGWGAVATVALVVQLSQTSLGGLIGLGIRTPITLVLISYLMSITTSLIPLRRDNRLNRRFEMQT